MNEPNVKQLAAVVHEVTKGHRFETWTDLAETVKCRCAALQLPYDSGSLTRAVMLVARTRPVFTWLRRSGAVS